MDNNKGPLFDKDSVFNLYKKYNLKHREECKFIKKSIIDFVNKTIIEHDGDLSKKKQMDIDSRKIEVLKFKRFVGCPEYGDLHKSMSELGIKFNVSSMYSNNINVIEFDVINGEVVFNQRMHLIN